MNKSGFNSQESEDAMQANVESLTGVVNDYYKWNLEVFPIKKNKRILDIGCGNGFYFNHFMQYSPDLYFATDYSKNFLDDIIKLFPENKKYKTEELDLTTDKLPGKILKEKFDYITNFDVLEHIEDHNKALVNIRNIMQKTEAQYLFLRVPALQCIYGVNDSAIGHYRRYSKRQLKKLLKNNGFIIKKIRYHNIIGILPWFLIGKVFKRTLAVSKNEGKLFNFIVPIIKFFEKIIPPPIGLSLYCICCIKKNNE